MPIIENAADFKPRQRPPGSARRLMLSPNMERRLESIRAAIAEPFVGVTVDGEVTPDLFSLQPTGVSTRPILDAARAYLDALTPDQRAQGTFDLESDAWRSWSNIHPFLLRHGVCLEQMDERQRDLALGLVEATLSSYGYETARNVMRLNGYIGEITNRPEEYSEWVYWLSIFGTPSEDQPWGWQIDGHHLIVNCLLLGDQLVLTPTFLGSEPVYAPSGKYAGTRVFAGEESQGLAFMRTLSHAQQERAIISSEAPSEQGSAFHDNLVLPYDGIRYDELDAVQQTTLLGLIETYVNQMRPGHAEIRMDEVKRHLRETHFTWAGGCCDDESVFYYRVHSPVILIEFDHQSGVALESEQPSRNHIHLVVRTPNGGDYGKDLLRQHHARFKHVNGAHVPR
jgi:hypothetical protein